MSIDEIMAQLQKEYAASLTEKIRILEENLKNKNWAALQEAFHKLKGTGKTYGFPHISIIGDKCESHLKEKGAESESLIQSSIELLGLMQKSFENHQNLQVEEDPRFKKIVSS